MDRIGFFQPVTQFIKWIGSVNRSNGEMNTWMHPDGSSMGEALFISWLLTAYEDRPTLAMSTISNNVQVSLSLGNIFGINMAVTRIATRDATARWIKFHPVAFSSVLSSLVALGLIQLDGYSDILGSPITVIKKIHQHQFRKCFRVIDLEFLLDLVDFFFYPSEELSFWNSWGDPTVRLYYQTEAGNGR